MPARSLKRYGAVPNPVNTDTIVVPVVPAARALVGKVVVSTVNAGRVILKVGGSQIATIDLLANETYTEGNLVLPTGASLTAQANVATMCDVHFFGEEVDN